MPVDRASRDKMARAIVAFMRKEIKARKFEDETDYVPSRDRVVLAATYVLWFFYDDFIDHPICISREGWDYLRRWLALLTSDYGVIAMEARCSQWSRPAALVVLCLLVAAVALLFPWGGGLATIPAWLVLGVVWFAIRQREKAENREFHKEAAQLRRRWPFGPFLSAEDWAAHEACLSCYDLPEYQAAVHAVPHRPSGPASRDDSAVPEFFACVMFLPFFLVAGLWPNRPDFEYTVHLRTEDKIE